MAHGILRYDAMVENALRGVLREALTITAENGLPGQHHFYITFRTRFPGVVIPDYVRARHPDEMTIVLQHQFWGLEVTDEYFEITLSFNRVNERLHVPFAAVCAFADPSAKFGLQFTVDPDLEYDLDDSNLVSAEDEDAADEEEAPLSPAKPAPASITAVPLKPVSDKAATTSEPSEERGQVIALDAFRKK